MNTALSVTADYMIIEAMLSKKELTQKLAKRIKELREDKGLSQEELTYQAGLYRTYIGHIENARYSPGVYVIYKIAKTLKVKSSDLLRF